MTADAQKETLGFQTEAKQLLHLMIHSLYSNREVFLRELISNASDAIDKLRFQSLADEKLLEDAPEFAITVEVDKEANTVTISDNGIGMSREDVIEHLGTPEDGKVISYHPITFFAVLAMEEAARALQVDEQGGAKVFGDKEIRRQAREDAKREAEFAEATGSQAERTTHWSIQDTNQGRELDGGGPGEVDVDDWLRWEQGEWEPEGE